MRWNHFGGSLLFALLAALGLPTARLILDPVLGPVYATDVYLLVTAALYALSIAPTLRRGVAGAALVSLLGVGTLLMGGRTSELVVALVAGIAVARSVLLYRVRVGRGLAIEVLLSLGGLLLARWFAPPGILGGSLALWGFFLAQSVYFPLSAATPRRRERSGDAFDEARARLQGLLRETEC